MASQYLWFLNKNQPLIKCLEIPESFVYIWNPLSSRWSSPHYFSCRIGIQELKKIYHSNEYGFRRNRLEFVVSEACFNMFYLKVSEVSNPWEYLFKCSCRFEIWQAPQQYAKRLENISSYLRDLTHWGRDNMGAISQTKISNACSWMKMCEVRLRFQWSLFVTGPINNIPALVQIMAWRRSGDKAFSEPMMVNLPTHICVTRPQWVMENLSHDAMSDIGMVPWSLRDKSSYRKISRSLKSGFHYNVVHSS